MSQLLEELLAAARPPAVNEVKLPELGKSVWVRELTAEQFLAMAAGLRELTGTGAEVARQRSGISLVAFLCDAEANAALSSIEDAFKLMQKLRFSSIRTILKAGQTLNAIDDEASERLEKN